MKVGFVCYFLYSTKCLLFFLLKISTRYLQFGQGEGIGKILSPAHYFRGAPQRFTSVILSLRFYLLIPRMLTRINRWIPI
ncbi:MAG: hypothetical protein A2162_04360 [Deltaproteobacteria bacterium RBG_13_52_11b]|nr:MAG: hypothetical protein A2162_04360 [Deltaproteobacteria bacterium RBG_13_52_11b]